MRNPIHSVDSRHTSGPFHASWRGYFRHLELRAHVVTAFRSRTVDRRPKLDARAVREEVPVAVQHVGLQRTTRLLRPAVLRHAAAAVASEMPPCNPVQHVRRTRRYVPARVVRERHRRTCFARYFEDARAALDRRLRPSEKERHIHQPPLCAWMRARASTLVVRACTAGSELREPICGPISRRFYSAQLDAAATAHKARRSHLQLPVRYVQAPAAHDFGR